MTHVMNAITANHKIYALKWFKYELDLRIFISDNINVAKSLKVTDRFEV